MTSLLIRCYPPRWRERYGDEFQALLDERPLGPYDIADILLGALDARLRLRGNRPEPNARGYLVSLRVGGVAAILGAICLALTGVGMIGGPSAVGPGLMVALLVGGCAALLVALTVLSGHQARAHPRLVWTAFVLATVGTIGFAIGALGLSGLLDLAPDGGTGGSVADLVFVIAFMAGLVGTTLFGVVTYRAQVLSRLGAVLLIVGPVVMLAAVGVALADWGLGALVMLAGFGALVAGWLALGVQALRSDRTTTVAQPA